MHAPPLPTPLAQLGNQRFSFYPPILGIQHNDWLYAQATWSEILVVNAKTGVEAWIPRRYVGDVSAVEEPFVIVGLLKQLEFSGGIAVPHQRRIIQMPVAVGAEKAVVPRKGPAPVIAISLHSPARVPARRMWVGALVTGVIACLAVAGVVRHSAARDLLFLELHTGDGVDAVERKLGQPDNDRWIAGSNTGAGDVRYRLLSYSQRGYTVVLVSRNRGPAAYAGVLDRNGNPLGRGVSK